MFRTNLIVYLLLISGCAAAPGGTEEPDIDTLPAGIWDVEAGERIELEELVDRHQEAAFILVAESHGEEWHHEVQGQIYDIFSDRMPQATALGMEMVERRFQDALDAFVAGDLDESEMLSEVEWNERWGVDYELYAPMWRRARQQKQPVVGLNARRELVRSIGESGIQGLSDEEREKLPEMDLSNDAYREHLRAIFSGHNHGDHSNDDDSAGLDRFYQAMVVWDETMAETAYEFMDDQPDIEVMVILAGRGHIERGHGIPSRLVRRGASSEEVITIVPVSTTGPMKDPMAKYRELKYLRHEKIADYVWIEPED